MMNLKEISYKTKISDLENAITIILTKTKFGKKQKNIPINLIFALDVSYSMYGVNLESAKRAISILLDKVWSFYNISVQLFVYSDDAEEIALPRKLKQAKRVVSEIRAQRSTNFISIFKLINKTISQMKRKQDICIIFLTDGEDTSDCSEGKPLLHRAMNKLYNTLQKQGTCSEVHSIGFTRNHDAVLMNEIAQIGTNQGTFSYVPNSEKIESTILNISTMIKNGSSILGKFKVNSKFNQNINFIQIDKEKKLQIENLLEEEKKEEEQEKKEENKIVKNSISDNKSLKNQLSKDFKNENENENKKENENKNENKTRKKNTNEKIEYFYADLFLPKITEEDFVSIEIICDHKDFLFEIEPIQINKPKTIRLIDLKLQRIRKRIMKLTDTLVNKNSSEEELKPIKKETDQLDQTLNEIKKVVFRMKKKERSEFIGRIYHLKEYMVKFYELLSLAISNEYLTNHQIASLNSLAYKSIIKSKLKKKLDKRSQKNIEMFQEMDEKILKIVQNTNFDLLETKQQKKEIQSQEEIGNCIISQLGWLEALKLGDCLCLSFDLGRNENAIADPSQIVIKEIFSSMISAQSYLDSVEYSLRLVTPSGDTNGISLGNSHVSVHGGFDTRNQGEVVKGQSREPITGILPLFICKENWNVARHKIRPVFGFMTTLNVLGYSYSQIASIPFLVLNKAAESLKTEFEKIRFNWIFETCQRIYQDSKQLRDEIILKFNNYLKTPLNRLKDVISNNAMFLAQCVVALHMGDIHFKSSQDIFKFLTFLIEEELRRRQPRKIRLLTQVEIIERCLTILNVDQEKYIEQPLKNYRKNVIKKIDKLDSYLYSGVNNPC
ncbi:hypothetical protein M0813_15645 [Anaeramoeba flamelloides]|uniref:VWFA domain-containing protein n=1 Tax=Anaeramoeba flamelloides TaxID=1746091 RepID=A0ABQ8Z2C1_9EUKA|nr:hypothetical protein M0813_15645 [Anaeramoeba flamelloides]